MKIFVPKDICKKRKKNCLERHQKTSLLKIATATDKGCVPNERYQFLLITYIHNAIAVRTEMLKKLKKIFF